MIRYVDNENHRVYTKPAKGLERIVVPLTKKDFKEKSRNTHFISPMTGRKSKWGWEFSPRRKFYTGNFETAYYKFCLDNYGYYEIFGLHMDATYIYDLVDGIQVTLKCWNDVEDKTKHWTGYILQNPTSLWAVAKITENNGVFDIHYFGFESNVKTRSIGVHQTALTLKGLVNESKKPSTV